MVTSISHSPEETLALGESWGRAAVPGLVFGLIGDLGAGKTQLAKGIARGVGVTERVHSPTFTIVNQYESGRLPVYHLDLFRLESPDQIDAAGIEDSLDPRGVTIIEWVERWPEAATRFPKRFVSVRIETINATDRRISYEHPGI